MRDLGNILANRQKKDPNMWQPNAFGSHFEQSTGIAYLMIRSFPYEHIVVLNEYLSNLKDAEGNPVVTAYPHEISGIDSLILRFNIKDIDCVKSKIINWVGNFLLEINKLHRAGQSTSYFSESSIRNIGNSITDALEDMPSKEDLERVNDKIAENWYTLSEFLENADFRDRLLAYEASPAFEDKFKTVLHHGRLSANNVRRVRMVDPEASFVTTPSAWKNVFKRKILPGAIPVIVDQFITPKYNKARRDKMADILGYNSSQEMEGDKRYGAQMSLITQKYADGAKDPTIIPVKMVDVRFTEPLDPNVDPWTEEIGLKSNLWNQVNNAALEYIKERGEVSQEDIDASVNSQNTPQEETPQEQPSMETVVRAFNSAFKKAVSGTGIQISAEYSPFDKCENNIFNYANASADSQEKVKPADREFFISIIVATMASILSLPTTTKIRQAYNNVARNRVNKEKAKEMYLLASPSIEDLDKMRPSKETLMSKEAKKAARAKAKTGAPLQEEEEITNNGSNWDVTLRKLLGLSTQESVMENFNNLLSRMNNLYKD